jgi:hypothetical protein
MSQVDTDSACNRNEYHVYFLGGKGGQYVGLITLPPSCADCHEIWQSHTPGTQGPVHASTGIALPLLCGYNIRPSVCSSVCNPEYKVEQLFRLS